MANVSCSHSTVAHPRANASYSSRVAAHFPNFRRISLAVVKSNAIPCFFLTASTSARSIARPPASSFRLVVECAVAPSTTHAHSTPCSPTSIATPLARPHAYIAHTALSKNANPPTLNSSKNILAVRSRVLFDVPLASHATTIPSLPRSHPRSPYVIARTTHSYASTSSTRDRAIASNAPSSLPFPRPALFARTRPRRVALGARAEKGVRASEATRRCER
mmetsp:Transcript_2181/g.8542  ORF Transcript_2181/g.8542 Transcript_2181/m.8542 type:complete len:220 (+) Transcript_2181:2786-3445(+)